MILEMFARDKYPGWASLASVCKEWQAVLEKPNFQKLKLRVSCLDDFKHMMVPQQKRDLVRHIWFEIRLPGYMSECCSNRVSTYVNHGTMVTKALGRLFSILSTWKPEHKLTLELNLACPSDSNHWFPNLYFSSDQVGDDEDTITPPLHDPRHGWVMGLPVEPPPGGAIQRLLQDISFNFNLDLPRVEAVACLIIRRQLRRSLCAYSIGCLLKSFGRLENIVYEPWTLYENHFKLFIDKGIYPFFP